MRLAGTHVIPGRNSQFEKMIVDRVECLGHCRRATSTQGRLGGHLCVGVVMLGASDCRTPHLESYTCSTNRIRRLHGRSARMVMAARLGGLLLSLATGP